MSFQTPTFEPGDTVSHRHNPDLGPGRIVSLDPRRIQVEFPDARKVLFISAAADALERLELHAGGKARYRVTGKKVGLVKPSDDGEHWHLTNGETVLASELLPLPQPPSPLERLASGKVDAFEDFRNRLDALRLLRLREAQGLGSFLGGRIRLFPHQLYVAEKACHSDPVRWLLADEVGLGKTVEACLILQRLVHTGRAGKILVLAPETLTVQWLGELWRKHHQVFALLDHKRLADVHRDFGRRLNPFEVYTRAILSFELLQERPSLARQAVEAGIDLLVVDEAHHLKRPPKHSGNLLYRAVQRITKQGNHVLLLSATPLEEDAHGFFRLLQMLRPEEFAESSSFEKRLRARRPLPPCTSATRRRDIGGLPPRKAFPVNLRKVDWAPWSRIELELRRLTARSPTQRKRRLEQLERSLSSPASLLNLLDIEEIKEPVDPKAEDGKKNGDSKKVETPAEAPVAAAAPAPPTKRIGRPKGTAIDEEEYPGEGKPPSRRGRAARGRGRWRRRRGRGEEGGVNPVEIETKVAELARDLLDDNDAADPEKDPRLAWLLEQLPQWRKDGDKVLLFVAWKDSMDALKKAIEWHGQTRVSLFHEELSPERRDLEVAQFRLPEGPTLLLSTECGGEGRNFEFCRRLVLYDLPLDPAKVEQRIGRLDRIGRKVPTEIVYFRPPRGLGRVAVELYEKLGVFREPQSGMVRELDRIAERLRDMALAKRPPEPDAFDDLLDSARKSRNRIRRAAYHELHRAPYRRRMAKDILQRVPPDLDELNEDVVLRAAARFGFKIEERRGPRANYIELGSEALVDRLPGVKPGSRFLGTFDREFAVEDEGMDYFASGHPLVEGVLAELEDGPRGRSAVFRLDGDEETFGLLALYKKGPEFEAVAVDREGNKRPDLVQIILEGEQKVHRVDAPKWTGQAGWKPTLERIAKYLPHDRPQAVAAFRVKKVTGD